MSPTASPELTSSVIAAEALSVTLRSPQGPKPVLRDLNFAAAPGETLTLLGESGAGLHVLLLTALGVLPAEPSPQIAGRIRLDRRRTGVMFRDGMLALDPDMRIGRQLAFRARRNRDRPTALQAAGLDPTIVNLMLFPHQLDGETRQRLMLAMAIAREPSLLLLEEPGSGLDVAARAALMQTIAALRSRSNMAIVLLTADPASAAAMQGRILVVHEGRIVERGATADVLSRPAHPYTEALLSARCRLTSDPGQRLLPIRYDITPHTMNPAPVNQGCAFRGPCPAGTSRCAQLPQMAPAQWHAGEVACWNTASPARRMPPPPRWPALPASGNAPLLRLDNVSFRYPTAATGPHGRANALSAITLQLGDREAIALTGKAGSGKSTVLRIAAGLLRPESGRRAYTAEELPQMIFADAKASLPPWRNVGDIVAERLRTRGLSDAERAARIEEALALAQMPPDAVYAMPHELTAAQAQRVAIARALIVPPKLLLCDDPLAMLDERDGAAVLNLLAGLRRTQRMALMFATSDFAAARYLTDRIIVLNEGRIEEQGPSATLAGNVQSPVGQALVALAAGPGPAVVAS